VRAGEAAQLLLGESPGSWATGVSLARALAHAGAPMVGDVEARDAKADEERLEGRVLTVTFHDARSRYTVLRVAMPGELEPATWVGRCSGPEEGAQISAAGSWVMHPVHGKQFGFSRLLVKAPTTLPGIQRRLERYPGLGKDKAEKIVKRFGVDTLSILDKQPRRLLEVEGIGPKTLERVIEHHKARSGPVAEVENLLVELEVPTFHAEALVRRYSAGAAEMLRSRPYRLAREVRGIGFMTADRIARALGVDMESDDRIDAGLMYVLEQAESEGHCALPMERLIAEAVRLLELPAGRIEEGVQRLLQGRDVLGEQLPQGPLLCFPAHLHAAEVRVARRLIELAITARAPWDPGTLPPHLSPGQAAAVRAIARNGLAILTGGPGTGKSTVIRQVIEVAQAHEAELLLAAPTGRAAKRLAEATRAEAKTIHRLLEIQGQGGAFTYNAGNPLPPGLVVIDEASMLDIALADALFSALTTEHRLLLVGDVDQLPSVGPGNVLRDLIHAASAESSPIPVVRLTQIFRQAEGSSIVVNAHAILSGSRLEGDSSGDGQFFVVTAREPERAHELVVKAMTERAPRAYGLDPRNDVQILCPMHKGRAGTEAFNRALQEHFTKGEPELVLESGGRPPRIFRVGDRVMQTRNDYDRGVFNGDIGRVTGVEAKSERLLVEIDGVTVMYERNHLAALQLAYAVTIHKSQGSEFPAVIIPLLTEHWVMLRRNLLYTAVTRAKRLCLLVGDPKAIAQAVRRSDAAMRHTGLSGRLVAALREALGESEIIEVD
jgi:exodeoxyribonuclease V alpha subunit